MSQMGHTLSKCCLLIKKLFSYLFTTEGAKLSNRSQYTKKMMAKWTFYFNNADYNSYYKYQYTDTG